jgi:hypothetical protein
MASTVQIVVSRDDDVEWIRQLRERVRIELLPRLEQR